MTRNHLHAVLHWRSYAGALDASQPRATIGTMLWACEQWLVNAHEADTEQERQVLAIKRELEAWFARYAPPSQDKVPATTARSGSS